LFLEAICRTKVPALAAQLYPQPPLRPAAPDVIPNPAPTLSGTSVRDLLFREQEWITGCVARGPLLLQTT